MGSVRVDRQGATCESWFLGADELLPWPELRVGPPEEVHTLRPCKSHTRLRHLPPLARENVAGPLTTPTFLGLDGTMCELYTTATQWRRCAPARSRAPPRPRRDSFDVLEALARGVIARGGDSDSTMIRRQELSVLANHRLASSREARDRERELAAQYRLARLERAQLREKARLEAPRTLDQHGTAKAPYQSIQDEEASKKPEAHAGQDSQELSAGRSKHQLTALQRSRVDATAFDSTSLCDFSNRRDSLATHDHVIDLRSTKLRPKQPLKTRLRKIRRRAFERMNLENGAVDRRASARHRRSML
jgi:hypothetical protein